MKVIDQDDWRAIGLTALLGWWPLSMAAFPDLISSQESYASQHAIYQNEWQRIIAGTNITDWILVAVGIGQLVILGVQAGIYHRQRLLMEGQLKATETAANAALAALDRPWLVVEVLGHNELAWLEGREPLIVEFQIANYGKAPAFIKSMRLLHFRSFNPNTGDKPNQFPGEFEDFPDADLIASFLYKRGKIPFIKKRQIDEPDSHQPTEFILGGGNKTEVLCLIGHGQRARAKDASVTDAVMLTKSYFAGSIYHEFPGQKAEILTFCYHREDYAKRFALFRDYWPYNGRQEAKGSEQ